MVINGVRSEILAKFLEATFCWSKNQLKLIDCDIFLHLNEIAIQSQKVMNKN